LFKISEARIYTTEVPADRSIKEIQDTLVKHGAAGVLYEYEKGTGLIEALRFRLPVKDQMLTFSLPVCWRRFQAVLKAQQVSRCKDEGYVYRVAWRNIRDWVLAQMALYETQMVQLPQVFLPFATGKNGQTLYEQVESGQLLLGEPRPHDE
jgi:hypothetical protein